ncbi:MAG: hypothetical protein KatS3mg012_2428 [Gaiellaceae bacterium]|jgi:hypothetical protein|nr:MAG: hypothetical protein KatS3mg012_2428 [Gaiellaceae bacterium]
MPRRGAAYAEQRISAAVPAVPVSDAGARRLGSAYWEEVRRFSRGLVRGRDRGEGLELRLAGVIPLLRFGVPVTTVSADAVECRYPITGGLLAAGPGGFLVLSQRGTGPAEVSIAVEEFHSRLAVDGRIGFRRRIFDVLQAPLHEGIGRRYLARAARGPL